MAKLQYTFKNDILFKMLFVRNPHLLKSLISVILKIPVESMSRFEIVNPEIPPEQIENKFCRLDINMRVKEQQINLEIQVNKEESYPDRVMYYWARDYSSALAAGEDYSLLPRTIVISIVDFELFLDSSAYYSFFQPLETTRHTLLSDKMGFYFFELPKLPENIGTDDPLLLWLSLFNADTEEQLKKINEMEEPVMREAINAYRTITTSPEYRELEKAREKARHDEATALKSERLKGIAEGRLEGIAEGRLEGIAKGRLEGIAEGRLEGLADGKNEKASEIASSLIKLGMPSSQIAEITGLPLDEVEKLRVAAFLS